jgi:hypothetical protein
VLTEESIQVLLKTNAFLHLYAGVKKQLEELDIISAL